MVSMFGTNGNNDITGGLSNDHLRGYGGDDSLTGLDGQDLLEGGDGNDTLNGGNGDDTLVGGNNDDELLGGGGSDTLSGDAGDDHIFGGEGSDTINGGDGADTVYAEANYDFIYASNGDDFIDGGDGEDTITVADVLDSNSVLTKKGGASGDNCVDLDTDYGLDKISNIETIEFSNGALNFGEADQAFVVSSCIDSETGNLISESAQDLRWTYTEDDLAFYNSDGSDAGNLQTAHDLGLKYSIDQINVNGISYDSLSNGDTIAGSHGTYTVIDADQDGTLDTIDYDADENAVNLLEDESDELSIRFFDADAGAGKETIFHNFDVVNHPIHTFTVSNPAGDSLGGTDVADTLYGGNGPDTLGGRGGDDLISGGNGEDSLIGGSGDDTLAGGNLDDTLSGGNGDDSLLGGSGDDHILGGNGDDTAAGNEGDDTFIGGLGDDRFDGDDGVDEAFGQEGRDYLNGGEGDDSLYGGANSDFIYGQANNDLIYGGNGDDYLDGGSHDDTIYGGEGNDTVSGNSGDNLIYGEAGNDRITASSGNDTLYGGTGKDTISSGQGDDLVEGGSGTDYIFESSGSNTLSGGNNNDYISGGSDDDSILAGCGDDTVFGGDGLDTLFINDILDDASDILRKGGSAGDNCADIITEDGRDSIHSVEVIQFLNGKITFGEADQALVLSEAVDSETGTMVSDDGADTRWTYSSDDLAFYNTDGTDAGHIQTATDLGLDYTIDQVTVNGDTYDGLSNGDTIEGAYGIFTVLDTDNDGSLDTIDYDPFESSSNLVDDSSEELSVKLIDPDASSGKETIFHNVDMVIDADEARTVTDPDGGALIGGGLEDTLEGNIGDDSLSGGNGDDSLFGGDGDDSLTGGADNDTLIAGNGDDSLFGGAGADSLVGGADSDSLSGGADNDTLIAGNGDDSLSGGAGDDLISGGAGDDTLKVEDFLDTSTSIIKSGGADGDNCADLITSEGNDQIKGIETIEFINGKITFGEADQALVLSEAVDSETGTMVSDDGADTRWTYSSDDLAFYNTDGTDAGHIQTATDLGLDYTIDQVTVNGDTYDGLSNGDTIEGAYGIFTVLDTDNDGSLDTIDYDPFESSSNLVDDSSEELSVKLIDPDASSGKETIFHNVDMVIDADEARTVTDPDGGALIGGGLEDTLEGNIGDDSLSGGNGDDSLFGGDGDDSLTGGADNDTLIAGNGDDSLFGGAGADSLVGGADSDSLSGGADNDTLIAGNGDDSLSGGAGDDLISGGAGDDTLKVEDFLDTSTSIIKSGGADGDNCADLITSEGNDQIKGIETIEFINGKITFGEADQALVLSEAVDSETGTMVSDDGADTRWTYSSDDLAFYNTDGTDAGHIQTATDLGLDYTIDQVTVNGDTYDGLSNGDTIEGAYGIFTVLDTDNDGSLDTIDYDPFESSSNLVDDSSEELSVKLIDPDAGSGKETIFHNVDMVIDADETRTVVTDPDGEYLGGNSLANMLIGGSGRDSLTGGYGDDTLMGEDGMDVLRGNEGHDLIIGGAGNDAIRHGDGEDTVDGGDGNDVIFAAAASDNCIDEDADLINGGHGRDTIGGGAGDDTIFASGARSDGMVFNDDGADADKDFVFGVKGDDLIVSGYWNDDDNDGDIELSEVRSDDSDVGDVLWAGSGQDTVWAGGGDDTIGAASGNDYIVAQGGDDVVYGAAGNDTVLGGSGDDELWAGSGDDLVYGNADNDLIYGVGGADTLNGGTGNDFLSGGEGDDLIVSSSGNDTLDGDSGHDTFLISAGSAEVDGGADGDIITITGGSDHRVTGGNGDDSFSTSGGASVEFVLDAGDDHYMLGTGADHASDIFVITEGNGFDHIIGLNEDEDILDFSQIDTINNVSDLLSAVSGDNSSVIDLGDGNYLSLNQIDDFDLVSMSADGHIIYT
ncbi:calcium-binding protein [Temperatibacter marinus]|uniref:Calcium-binding protein n=1 Tax=Temperatibacter marinus TaxID=1456591 RepID=A0AA52HA29_9PROT|nr:calcium-binding protein [Temperatibacter marinus]WND03187.1 calcium-binding protein [Temperatibacter marinus]